MAVLYCSTAASKHVTFEPGNHYCLWITGISMWETHKNLTVIRICTCLNDSVEGASALTWIPAFHIQERIQQLAATNTFFQFYLKVWNVHSCMIIYFAWLQSKLSFCKLEPANNTTEKLFLNFPLHLGMN